MSTYDLILKGGRVIDPSQKLDGIADVAFAGGKVAAVGANLARGPQPTSAASKANIVSPGLIAFTRSLLGRHVARHRRRGILPHLGRNDSNRHRQRRTGKLAGFRKHVIERSEVRILAISTSRSPASSAFRTRSWSARARTCA